MTATIAPQEADVAPGSVPRPPARTSARQARATVVGAAVLLSIAGVVVAVVFQGPVRGLGLAGDVGATVHPSEYVDRLMGPALALAGALVVLRGLVRRYGWLLLAAGASSSVLQAAEEYALYATFAEGGVTLQGAKTAVWVQDLWLVPFVLLVFLLPVLFPDARPAPGLVRPVQALAIAWGAYGLLQVLADRPAQNAFLDLPRAPRNPTGVLPVSGDVLNGLWVALTLSSIVVVVLSLVRRWRQGGREVRQQIAWVLAALALAGAVMVLTTVNIVLLGSDATPRGSELLEWFGPTLQSLSWLVLVIAIGVAVLRHRLYELDLVVNRTVVYLVTTVLLLVAYVAVVALVGDVAGGRGDGARLVATGVVAVAFAPLRAAVQGAVNRVMFGDRDDPFAVLRELGDVLARSGAPTATLRAVVTTITDALKVPGAAIEVERDGDWAELTRAGSPASDEAVVSLVHAGEGVGRLLVARRSPAESLHAADRQLLEGIAPHVAALVHGVRLTLELQRSRELLVAAREEERRRLRRDLHDGLGPSLASQTFSLDAALELLDGQAPRAAALLEQIKDRNRDLVADIRRLVYELRPPALDELGLLGALAAHAGALLAADAPAIEVSSDPAPLGPLPAGAEVAAYRIASEALTNAVRHADATTVRVHVTRDASVLELTVEDDGSGVPGDATAGVGMHSMHERAAELGGTCTVTTGPTGGACVRARVPLAAPSPLVDPLGCRVDDTPAPTHATTTAHAMTDDRTAATDD